MPNFFGYVGPPLNNKKPKFDTHATVTSHWIEIQKANAFL